MKRSSCGRGWGDRVKAEVEVEAKVEVKVKVKAKAKVEVKAVTGRSLGTTCMAAGRYAWLTGFPIGVASFI